MAQITTIEKVLLTANPTTKGTTANPGGLPAPVEGDPTWTFDGANDSLCTLEPVAGTLTCWLGSGDVPGTATVKCTADADLGSGVVEISVLEPVTVTAAAAAGMNVTIGEPVIE